MSTRNDRRSPCSISDPEPAPHTAWRRQRTPFLRSRHILTQAAGLPARGRDGSSSESACGLLAGARGILTGNSPFAFDAVRFTETWFCAVFVFAEYMPPWPGDEPFSRRALGRIRRAGMTLP